MRLGEGHSYLNHKRDQGKNEAVEYLPLWSYLWRRDSYKKAAKILDKILEIAVEKYRSPVRLRVIRQHLRWPGWSGKTCLRGGVGPDAFMKRSQAENFTGRGNHVGAEAWHIWGKRKKCAYFTYFA